MKQIPPAHKVVGDEGAPGQLWTPPRYLRDIVKAAQERASEELEYIPAPSPSTDAEKRLERVLGALATWKRNELNRNKGQATWVSQEIDGILRENP